jgi:hypothetical protein
MHLALPVFSMVIQDVANWRADWAWGLPIIVLTVIIHVLGLGTIGQHAARASKRVFEHRHRTLAFAVVIGTATLMATCLHATEAGIWALAYRLLGALPDNRSAMLYSLNAITSYGHADLMLKQHWQLMGALEALNGWLLFGLTTAFLFAMIEKVWSLGNQRDHH